MKSLFSVFGCLALSCLVIALGLTPAPMAAETRVGPAPSGEPVKIGRVNLGPEKRDGGLSVEVENTSGRVITHLELLVEIADSKTGGASHSFPLRYGRLPVLPGGDGPATAFRPGAKLTLSPPAQALARGLGEKLRSASAADATVGLRVAFFQDGTSWARGSLHVPEPGNTLRWRVARPSADRAGSKLEQTFQLVAAAYAPRVFAPRRTECGTYAGYEVIICCRPDPSSEDYYYAYSDIVDYSNPSGNATLRPRTDQCPFYLGGGTCTYNQVVPCS